MPFIVVCIAHHTVGHRLASADFFGAAKAAANYLLFYETENLNEFHYSLFTGEPIDDVMCVYSDSQLNSDNAAVYDTVIFAGPPPMKQRLWPRHCVQDTWGSELHKDLKVRYQNYKQ